MVLTEALFPRTADMLCDTNYHLQLYVEGDKQQMQEWKKYLESELLLVPQNAKLYSTSRVMKIELGTTTPIAKMAEDTLRKVFKDIYTNKMAMACRLLVEKIEDYK